MKWLLVALLAVILFMLFRRRTRQVPQCKSLACEVETKRPVPVMMPYSTSWEVPQMDLNYKYF
jgi:hypothetical protein